MCAYSLKFVVVGFHFVGIINGAYNGMSFPEGYFFDGMTHFAISYQYDFHSEVKEDVLIFNLDAKVHLLL